MDTIVREAIDVEKAPLTKYARENAPMVNAAKTIQTVVADKTIPTVPKNQASRFSFFSTINSMIPKEILGVQVTEIRKDLKEGSSQITSL